jgi:mutator protein MutT
MSNFVRAIIKNINGEVLMVYSAKYHQWNLPGGKINPGERPENAIMREVKEEVNLDTIAFRKKFEHDFRFREDCARGYFFEMMADLSEIKITRPYEIARVGFFPLSSITGKQFSTVIRSCRGKIR